jgi:3',5'-cyclic AMP phosphodiesterase CpdA
MSVLLQVSDPHFGTERAPVVEALVALAQRERPALVVLSGDITQRARPAQFRAARAFADRLGAPLLAIPGNHDLPLFDLVTRMIRPYARYRAAFGDELEPVFASDAWLVIGVNTTRPARHENGEVDDVQVGRVAARLAAATPAQLRVVVVHQPAAVMRAEDEHDRLIGHAAALSRWSAAGADVVMGGHIHLPYVLPVGGVTRPLWVVQAGTAVSERVREGVPNSVNLVRWDGRGAQVEQWDCPAGGPAFSCRAVTTLSPARAHDGR